MLVIRRLSVLGFTLAGILLCVLLVTFIAPWADASPDGLEKVSADKGIDAAATAHDLAGSPLADYGVDGVGSPVLATGLAGIAGVAATFVVGAGVVWVVRRRRQPA